MKQGLKIKKQLLFIFLLNILSLNNAELSSKSVLDGKQRTKVNKCCEENELYIGDSCMNYKKANETLWIPTFVNERGKANLHINPEYIIGYPDCGSSQRWAVFDGANSSDTLRLLPSGVLRHYTVQVLPGNDDEDEIEAIHRRNRLYYDHEHGKYCMDKRVDSQVISKFAWICSPDKKTDWTETDFIMRNIVSPITHVIAIGCYLMIAIVYFIMPSLRDLTGNIVTTICLCLIINECADLIRLLTVLNSHLSILITDAIGYFSLLSAFFWLNSFGFYIWKTFRSRNVFLRITDSKKYCYYSAYVWTCTIILAIVAVFSHFTMDYSQTKPKSRFEKEPDEIGSLGMVIFFVPVAFTILIDVFFFTTTLKIINRMHTYGRIHHKLRHSFRMFVLLLLVMTTTWIFFLSSCSQFDGLFNAYIIVNALQGPIILYICIINQKHVAYLMRKTCCYTSNFCRCCKPQPECEWGDEMTAMNTNNY